MFVLACSISVSCSSSSVNITILIILSALVLHHHLLLLLLLRLLLFLLFIVLGLCLCHLLVLLLLNIMYQPSSMSSCSELFMSHPLPIGKTLSRLLVDFGPKGPGGPLKPHTLLTSGLFRPPKATSNGFFAWMLVDQQQRRKGIFPTSGPLGQPRLTWKRRKCGPPEVSSQFSGSFR